MKILIINTVPFTRNGISTLLMNYYRCFDHTTNEISFVVNKSIDSSFESEIKENGDLIYTFENRNKKQFKYIKFLRQLCKEKKFDIAYINGNSATMAVEEFALRNLNVKKVVHAHAVTTEHALLHKIFYPYFIRNYDMAFASSNEAGHFLFKEKNFKVIKNGIDYAKFKFSASKRVELRDSLGLNDNKVLIQVATFTENKNHIFSLEVLKKLVTIDNKYKLLLLGAGQLEKTLKEKIKEYNLQNSVIFLGEVNNTEDFYSVADIAIFPSLHESFGIVALEAQANGLPIYVSDKFISEIKITDNLEYVPLDSDMWVNKIRGVNSRQSMDSVEKQLSNSDYVIQNNYKDMINYFKELIDYDKD